MSIKKLTRIKVWNKYGQRCAYCGEPITYKEMQVDHLKPKAFGGSDDFDNLMPSCRTCNHYKRALSLEDYRREWLGRLHERLKKQYTIKVALKYGIIELNEFSGNFYFELYERYYPKDRNTELLIPENLLDCEGYPTTEYLNLIKRYSPQIMPLEDFVDKVIRQGWYYSDWGFVFKRRYNGRRKLELHTAGWSGNEDVIYELRRNITIWRWWKSSFAGGHHYFEIPCKNV